MGKLYKFTIILLCYVSFGLAWPTFGSFNFDGIIPIGGETISYEPDVTIAVGGTNVSFNAFVLYIDGVNVLSTSPYNYSYNITSGIFRYQVTSALGKGNHTFQIFAQDQDGGLTSAITTVFVASDKFAIIEDPIIYPSPATKNAKITYELTAAEEVKLYIYDLSGQIVYQDDIQPGSEGAHAGFNAYNFDLKSSYGNELPNGVYVVILARKDGGTTKILGKKKFIILRDDEK